MVFSRKRAIAEKNNITLPFEDEIIQAMQLIEIRNLNKLKLWYYFENVYHKDFIKLIGKYDIHMINFRNCGKLVIINYH